MYKYKLWLHIQEYFTSDSLVNNGKNNVRLETVA